MSVARPDSTDRSEAGLAATFRHFARHDVPPIGSPLYEVLAEHVATDAALLSLSAAAPSSQPPPNQLLAAVHYLLLGGAQHPLRDHYPVLRPADCDAPPLADAPARLSAFCAEHGPALRELIRTRRTQTNIVRRAALLLPAFAHVAAQEAGRPLSQIEIGCSAGLNLHWDRFHYEYRDERGAVAHSWGDERSPVRITSELRGGRALPSLPDGIAVASRVGVDLSPIAATDPDQQRWLRALIWPEHVDRHARLQAAVELAQRHPAQVMAGDAGALLPQLLAALPSDTAACVFATFTLYQFDQASMRALFSALKNAASARPVHFVSCELTGDACAELWWTCWSPQGKARELLATCDAHGQWLRWAA